MEIYSLIVLEARSRWSPCSLLPASSSFQWLRIPLGLGHITSISASVFTRPSPPSIFPFSLSLLFWYLFIYLWLCWVFIAAPRLSLAAASGGSTAWVLGTCASAVAAGGLQSTGPVVVAPGLSFSMWELPRPEIESMAGGFLITGPSGKSWNEALH